MSVIEVIVGLKGAASSWRIAAGLQSMPLKNGCACRRADAITRDGNATQPGFPTNDLTIYDGCAWISRAPDWPSRSSRAHTKLRMRPSASGDSAASRGNT